MLVQRLEKDREETEKAFDSEREKAKRLEEKIGSFARQRLKLLAEVAEEGILIKVFIKVIKVIIYKQCRFSLF